MERRRLRLEAREREVAAMYGVASVEEFDAARADLELAKREGIREEHDETFREDYEIYGAQTGTVKVRYKGGCEVCGLSLSFEHEHEFYDPAKEE